MVDEASMDDLFSALDEAGARTAVFWSDVKSGLRAVVVIDDVTLGPAAGGVRTQPYPSVRDAIEDATKLARAMTLKCSLGGLDAGGGKIVVIDHPYLDRRAAFEELGRRLNDLGGLFNTGSDLGTSRADLDAMAQHTGYVHTKTGRFANAVARGLVRCVEACAAEKGRDVSGLKVAIQGCGAIGAAAARALKGAGCELVLSDVREARAQELADEVGAERCDPADVLSLDVDIVSPNAVGGVMTAHRAEQVKAWAVCGAANNVLSDPSVDEIFMRRGILFVPDVIASGGAVIDGIGESVMGLDDRTKLIDALGETAREVLFQSRQSGRTPTVIAEERARARIDEVRRSGPRAS
jgi:leucine dehydrogenase